MLKLTAALLAVVCLCLAGTTYIALESGGVLVVETVNHANGDTRATHIWYVLENDRLILEAGNPMNPWVKDIELQPKVRIFGDNLDGQYQLSITRDPAGHSSVRSLMRDKYGWRDVWIAMLFDTSRSKLVEATQI